MQTSSKPPGALPAVSAIKSYDWKIPATLGVPIGTIMSRLFPGKAQLRCALAKAIEGEPKKIISLPESRESGG